MRRSVEDQHSVGVDPEGVWEIELIMLISPLTAAIPSQTFFDRAQIILAAKEYEEVRPPLSSCMLGLGLNSLNLSSSP